MVLGRGKQNRGLFGWIVLFWVESKQTCVGGSTFRWGLPLTKTSALHRAKLSLTKTDALSQSAMTLEKVHEKCFACALVHHESTIPQGLLLQLSLWLMQSAVA